MSLTAALLLLLLNSIHGYVHKVCNKFDNSGALRHQSGSTQGDVDYACNAMLKRLYCCVSGKGVTIRWSYVREEKWVDPTGVYFSDHNQTLTIQEISPYLNEGRYTCFASNRRDKPFTRTIYLRTQDCSDDTHLVYIKPLTNHRKRLYGENVTFTCQAWFPLAKPGHPNDNGCVTDRGNRVMLWSRRSGNSSHVIINESTKYNVTLKCRSGQIWTLTLTIKDIQPGDLATYRCQMKLDGNPIEADYFLSYGEDNPSITRMVLMWGTVEIVASVVGAVAFLFLLFIIGYRRGLHTYFMLTYKDKFGKRPSEGLLHDVVFVYNTSHTSNAEQAMDERTFINDILLPEFEEKLHYKCFTDCNILPGRSVLEETLTGVSQSHLVVIIVSPALLEGGISNFTTCSALADGNKKVVFLLYEIITKQQWRVYKRLWSEHDVLRKALKIMTTIKWNNKNQAQIFRKIRLFLPPIPHDRTHDSPTITRDNDDRLPSDSSACGLLSPTINPDIDDIDDQDTFTDNIEPVKN